MGIFLSFANGLLAIAKWITVVLMAGMTISILLGVFFRFVVADPLIPTFSERDSVGVARVLPN